MTKDYSVSVVGIDVNQSSAGFNHGNVLNFFSEHNSTTMIVVSLIPWQIYTLGVGIHQITEPKSGYLPAFSFVDAVLEEWIFVMLQIVWKFGCEANWWFFVNLKVEVFETLTLILDRANCRSCLLIILVAPRGQHLSLSFAKSAIETVVFERFLKMMFLLSISQILVVNSVRFETI